MNVGGGGGRRSGRETCPHITDKKFTLCPCSLAIQGLRVGDLVIEFGSVSVDNFRNVQDIGTLVQHSQEVRRSSC